MSGLALTSASCLADKPATFVSEASVFRAAPCGGSTLNRCAADGIQPFRADLHPHCGGRLGPGVLFVQHEPDCFIRCWRQSSAGHHGQAAWRGAAPHSWQLQGPRPKAVCEQAPNRESFREPLQNTDFALGDGRQAKFRPAPHLCETFPRFINAIGLISAGPQLGACSQVPAR